MRVRGTGLFSLAALAASAAFALAGCSTGMSIPSKADASKALQAMTAAQDRTPPMSSQGTYGSGTTFFGVVPNPGGGGSAVVSYSASNPSSRSFTADGMLTFTNWYDPGTGYTINGTLTVMESVTGAGSLPETISATVSGDLTLSGGPVSTLSCDMTETLAISSLVSVSDSLSGTVTENGTTFDVSQL